ncbi:MAG: hypothetical protein ACOX4M_05235 [Acetivibrionales bacterium]|jgi:hypothetical protein
MVLFLLFMLAMGIIEIYYMLKHNRKKDIVVYLMLLCAATAAGLYYLAHPDGEASISRTMPEMAGIRP